MSFHQRILQECERKSKSKAIKTTDPALSENNKTTHLSAGEKKTQTASPTPADPTLEDIHGQQMKNESVVLQFIQSFSIQLLSTLHKADLAVAQIYVYRIAPLKLL